MFTDEDRRFMKMALCEARTALDAGDYPVGAALVVNDELLGTARNSLFTDDRSTSHAEHNLLYQYSSQLRTMKLRKSLNEDSVCLYTTLEPCLMCLGTSVLHRVSKIIVACPDPNGGATGISPTTLGSVYEKWWPKITTGLYREESYDLIVEFLKNEQFISSAAMLKEFDVMRQEWD